jgi:hypothetical protein
MIDSIMPNSIFALKTITSHQQLYEVYYNKTFSKIISKYTLKYKDKFLNFVL